ncbi:suppressor of glycerol defect [Purpureocillium takamizusanense]|uniref:Suppressor of glycerol defect n=1 Tax=Purpureocillium takamizusanense TaxID=2060973 RepID=A0A9Q8VA12_9HYPO|nr:suppressor of glycerol defect [Purpureocillium takamizusanense]UNI17342.1 suppressor of glycerol defect [Purpureocillium takamizusanense]
MPAHSVPELQQKLFRRMGLDAPTPGSSLKAYAGRRTTKPVSRRDERKAQRAQKRSQRYSQQDTSSRLNRSVAPRPAAVMYPTDPVRPKREQPVPPVNKEDDDKYALSNESDLEEQAENDDHHHATSGRQISPSPEPRVMTAGGASLTASVREKLSQDDAEIEDFERKLGIKKNRKSLPKAFTDDGLDELLGDFTTNATESEDEGRKRKRNYDDWLSSKRRKAISQPAVTIGSDSEQFSDHELVSEGSDDHDDFGDAIGLSETTLRQNKRDVSDEPFRGFGSDADDATEPVARKRENPYVAPTTGTKVTKYVPPSMRNASASEDEVKDRLRKQVQGQINRLTDSNILPIVDAIESLYQRNARGDVTEILTDAMLAQICKPEALPDQFLVLIGGLCAAMYKIVGSSFGSHLIRRIVNDFRSQFERADRENSEESSIRKEASNIITFLTQLYVFEVVSCRILFDYLERFLGDLSEINVELLLRVCRMAGRLLRRDDPQALKHVSSTLSKAVSRIGYAHVSARTKFMIETINDLKNSKSKAKGTDSGIVSEHVLRIRKRLGELKSRSRRLDGLAPMGMSLKDVEGSDTQGKWWLVGASVPTYVGVAERAGNVARGRGDTGNHVPDDEEDMDFVLPDYPKKARAQGLSTASQIAIFTAVLSANSHEDGYQQFVNLKLKRDEQLEIARVLVQCVGSEARYNEYYALVGGLACQNSRVRFALQDRLWKIFRGLGESLFGEDGVEEDTADSERMKDERRAANVAQFYASLVADGSLSISVLKPLELPEVNRWTSAFVEGFLVALLRRCTGKDHKEEATVLRVFGPARETPTLAVGIHWFLRKRVRQSKLIGVKDSKKLQRVRQRAQAVVQAMDIGE